MQSALILTKKDVAKLHRAWAILATILERVKVVSIGDPPKLRGPRRRVPPAPEGQA